MEYSRRSRGRRRKPEASHHTTTAPLSRKWILRAAYRRRAAMTATGGNAAAANRPGDRQRSISGNGDNGGEGGSGVVLLANSFDWAARTLRSGIKIVRKPKDQKGFPSSRDGGRSSARWPGWPRIAAWPATMNRPSGNGSLPITIEHPDPGVATLCACGKIEGRGPQPQLHRTRARRESPCRSETPHHHRR